MIHYKYEEDGPLNQEELDFLKECNLHEMTGCALKVMTEDSEGAYLSPEEILRLSDILRRYVTIGRDFFGDTKEATNFSEFIYKVNKNIVYTRDSDDEERTEIHNQWYGLYKGLSYNSVKEWCEFHFVECTLDSHGFSLKKNVIQCDVCDGVGTTEGGRYLMETNCEKCYGHGVVDKPPVDDQKEKPKGNNDSTCMTFFT